MLTPNHVIYNIGQYDKYCANGANKLNFKSHYKHLDAVVIKNIRYIHHNCIEK